MSKSLIRSFAFAMATFGSAGAMHLHAPAAATTLDRAVEPATMVPLSDRDVSLYRRIFAYQEDGEWDRADALIRRLHDRLLLGHVQQQRYMHPDAYRSTFEELSTWLDSYADHPGADRLYRLARKRRPSGAEAPQKPVRGYLGGAGQGRQEVNQVVYRSGRERSSEEAARVEAVREAIGKLVRNRQPETAAAQLKDAVAQGLLDETEIDLARWQVAQAYLAVNAPMQALKLVRPAAFRSGRSVPQMHWTAGIGAWRHGRTDLAIRHFAALATAESAHPSEQARAAFWAARAHVIRQKPQEAARFLRIAAEHPQSFYGLLARAALGRDRGHDWPDHGSIEEALGQVRGIAGVDRALALSQIGRKDLAEQEIRKLAARAKPALLEPLIPIAAELDLPAVQMRIAQSLRHRRGLDHHGAMYPMPSWQPIRGFTLDRALIYAVMRAESAFDPWAKSHAGARGLMQVMPATAREVASRSQIELIGTDALFEPTTGIMVGQAYLTELLGRRSVERDLIMTAIAYNAGPRRVSDWRRALEMDHDPMLFLESIPLSETRIYVKKVLLNLWHYRDRLGQPRPSLRTLASNRWPTYRPLDARPELHAWN